METQHPTTFTPDARFLLGLLPESTSIANRVYGLLGKGFELPGQLLSKVGQRVPEREVDTMTLNVRAAINGVFGDLLVRHNPLAFESMLYGDTSRPASPPGHPAVHPTADLRFGTLQHSARERDGDQLH